MKLKNAHEIWTKIYLITITVPDKLFKKYSLAPIMKPNGRHKGHFEAIFSIQAIDHSWLECFV